MADIRFDRVTFSYPEADAPVFKDLSIEIPAGIVSLVGQNGTGKTTLMLLAGGVVIPDSGKVTILGMDSKDLSDESERQQYVSFIQQNMEFETEEPIGKLLDFVYENGYHEKKSADLVGELVNVFELSPSLDKKTQEISKGELQRTILAFSFLYGSKIIMMDEPVFSLEQYQKERAFEFIVDYAGRTATTVCYSAHELELTEKYSDYIILFHKNGTIEPGPKDTVFTVKNIEAAYEVPYNTLKHKEALFREFLKG
jgi:iron complex transport system ATP-binding protein